MLLGLSAPQRQRIEEQYHRAMAEGLWKDAYAATNAGEYWAELSMWYFGGHANGARRSGNVPGPGRPGLRSYDPGGFALVDDLYGAAP
jgi:alpha-glucosidase